MLLIVQNLDQWSLMTRAKTDKLQQEDEKLMLLGPFTIRKRLLPRTQQIHDSKLL